LTISCPVKESKNGCTFDIHVTPRASRAAIAGVQDGALKIKVTALPVEGEANAACIKFLAKEMGLKKSRMTISIGQKSRNKTVMVNDITKQELEKIINSLLK
jgi:uncharacterized protein (TIGR00251 family)